MDEELQHFENICTVSNLAKPDDTSFDVDNMPFNESARQAFQCCKKILFSKEDDVTILDIICLDAIITATISSSREESVRNGTERCKWNLTRWL